MVNNIVQCRLVPFDVEQATKIAVGLVTLPAFPYIINQHVVLVDHVARKEHSHDPTS